MNDEQLYNIVSSKGRWLDRDFENDEFDIFQKPTDKTIHAPMKRFTMSEIEEISPHLKDLAKPICINDLPKIGSRFSFIKEGSHISNPEILKNCGYIRFEDGWYKVVKEDSKYYFEFVDGSEIPNKNAREAWEREIDNMTQHEQAVTEPKKD